MDKHQGKSAVIQLILGILILFILSAPVNSQELPKGCIKTETALLRLENKYKEVPGWYGVTNRGLILQLILQDKGGTWTILLSSSAGISCIIETGEGWRFVEPKEPGPRT